MAIKFKIIAVVTNENLFELIQVNSDGSETWLSVQPLVDIELSYWRDKRPIMYVKGRELSKGANLNEIEFLGETFTYANETEFRTEAVRFIEHVFPSLKQS